MNVIQVFLNSKNIESAVNGKSFLFFVSFFLEKGSTKTHVAKELRGGCWYCLYFNLCLWLGQLLQKVPLIVGC